MITRRTVLKTIAYVIPLSLGADISPPLKDFTAKPPLADACVYSVRYIYKGAGRNFTHVAGLQKAFENKETIAEISRQFAASGLLVEFFDQSNEHDLIFDYTFVSEAAHNKWENLMQENYALNLHKRHKVTVQNFYPKLTIGNSKIDRTVIFKMA